MSKKYDVAVSYASEQRYYVESFVKYLKFKKIKVYYDRDEQVQMQGTLLHEKLACIYSSESILRIIFLSQEYVAKPLTILESEIILAENVFEKNRMYIFKFDDSTLPGLNKNIVYASIQDYPNPQSYGLLIYSIIKKDNCMGYNPTIYSQLKILLMKRIYKYRESKENQGCEIEEQFNKIIIRNKNNGKVNCYFQIEESTNNSNVYIWMYSNEPMEKKNTYNAYIRALTQSNISQKYLLYNNGAFTQVDENVFYNSLEELVDYLFSKITSFGDFYD